MKKSLITNSLVSFLLAFAFLASNVHANVSLESVTVGNPGNAADSSTDQKGSCGAG